MLLRILHASRNLLISIVYEKYSSLFSTPR
jgi:hypothetical protein